MDNDLLFQIALTKVPNIGNVHAKTLVEIFKNAENIFRAPTKQLEKIEGIGYIRAKSIRDFNNFQACEKEIRFIEKNKIAPLFISSEKYPKRLLNCYDNPILLFYKGVLDINCYKIISIVGTRNNTEYGKINCHNIIEGLVKYNIATVSGLAYGIDTIVHKTSLAKNIPSFAVLAHGLDRIYPFVNNSLAEEMIENGGLFSEFGFETNPDKQNFPKRNRITAGICDALIVIESGKKGGSLITAELANSYNKDIFAVPGRTTDSKSEGCNVLIQENKAVLINSAEDVIKAMAWDPQNNPVKKTQLSLFYELSINEEIIMRNLSSKNQMSIDQIFEKANLSSSNLAAALLSLELKNLITALPGKIYKAT